MWQIGLSRCEGMRVRGRKWEREEGDRTACRDISLTQVTVMLSLWMATVNAKWVREIILSLSPDGVSSRSELVGENGLQLEPWLHSVWLNKGIGSFGLLN